MSRNPFGLWWSLLWRFTLLFFALSYAIGWAVNATFTGDDVVTLIKWRPTIFWWSIAVILWTVSAASTRFLTNVIWGERLRLSPDQWLTASRAVSAFCLILGGLNLLVAYLASTDTWVNFKLFALYPLLMVFFAFLSVKLGRSACHLTAPNTGS